MVLDNVRTLGHDPAQIKYVVVTHGHADHAGGAARIQQATGARVMMALADWDSLGGRLTRDLVINDGDRLTLGEIELWFYLIGGHTAGNVATEIHGLVNGREFRTVIGVTFAPAPGMTARQILAGESLPAPPTKHPPAVGAQRVNQYLDQIRAAMERRLAGEQKAPAPRR